MPSRVEMNSGGAAALDSIDFVCSATTKQVKDKSVCKIFLLDILTLL